MFNPEKKQILKTIILCLVTLLLTFPKLGGFILGFVLLFLVPSLLKSLYFIIIKNKERKQRTIQTLLWTVTCSIIIIHHVYLHKTTQNFAIKVSNSVLSYKQERGNYPESYEVLGFDKKIMREYRLYYSYKDKTPYLFYPATWIPFDTYIFNFETHRWDYQAD